jgi:L-ascorbate metabolism protein UlaG (beta-lactamase superfamily)
MMRLTWLGHSCFRIETAATVLLIDPFLKGNPPFEASGIAWDDATAGVTHIALSHGHDDHIGDTVEIAKARGATLFATYELSHHLAGRGVQHVEAMNIGGTVAAADIDVTLTQALHSSSSNGVYLGNPCGIVVKSREGRTVYHMGDTDVFGDMRLIHEFHKPDVGIVPIGDRFTMGAKSAAYACKTFFEFKMVIPCHYGTFPNVLAANADQFIAEMKGQEVIVPKVGQVVTL